MCRGGTSARNWFSGLVEKYFQKNAFCCCKGTLRAYYVRMKKTFKLADWKKMRIHKKPTDTSACVRLDSEGKKWEWLSSGKRVEARAVV